jgi:GTP cyclohydrolase II
MMSLHHKVVLYLCIFLGIYSIRLVNGSTVDGSVNVPTDFSKNKSKKTNDASLAPTSPSPSSPTTADHQTDFIAECELPTKLGSFRMRSYVYTSKHQRLEPVVLIAGDVSGKANVLTRIHDQCFTSEVRCAVR